MKRLIRAATTAVVVVAGYGVVASPANATGASGCPWPYVCFYTMAGFYKGTPVAMYKDITASWQYLGTGRGAAVVYNARNDDGARVHTTSGKTYCVRPNEYFWPSRSRLTVDRVQIVDSPTC